MRDKLGAGSRDFTQSCHCLSATSQSISLPSRDEKAPLVPGPSLTLSPPSQYPVLSPPVSSMGQDGTSNVASPTILSSPVLDSPALPSIPQNGHDPSLSITSPVPASIPPLTSMGYHVGLLPRVGCGCNGPLPYHWEPSFCHGSHLLRCISRPWEFPDLRFP